MRLEVKELTEANLTQAPEWGIYPFSCKYCIYWEHPELCTDPAAEAKEEGFEKKLAWLWRVRREWGGCGKLVCLDGKGVGYAQYAPARFFPGVASYPAGPVSEDAVFLACLFIPKPKHRGQGLGSLLLRTILDELHGRDVRAVETFARRGSPENPSGPVELYLRNGFEIHRDHPEFPLLRLKLA